jgi:hypothetical protein
MPISSERLTPPSTTSASCYAVPSDQSTPSLPSSVSALVMHSSKFQTSLATSSCSSPACTSTWSLMTHSQSMLKEKYVPPVVCLPGFLLSPSHASCAFFYSRLCSVAFLPFCAILCQSLSYCTVISDPSNTRAALARSHSIGQIADPDDHKVSQIPPSSARYPNTGLRPARARHRVFFVLVLHNAATVR